MRAPVHKAATNSLYFDYPYFPFQAPPEMSGPAPRHPVVVVGGGPVGYATALSLARHGVSATVIEMDDSVADGSRAVCISKRSMDILHALGLAETFRAKGLEWTSGRSFYRGQVVFELEMPHSADERFLPMTNLQQCYIEQFLVDRIAETDRVEIRWQSRVTGIDAQADPVTLTVATPEGDYEMTADWVVAADGARSTLRDLMRLRLSGTSYEGRYLIADIKMASPHPIERRAFFDPPSNPGLTVLMHKQPDDIWRIDYQLADDVDEAAELDEDRIRARIQAQLDMIGETTPWQLEWYSLYKAHCLALDDYRQGRVLFAGDAAHLVPIFGVRGLNSGFADADNLGWKLAWVVRGLAPEALLDSYSPERRAATQEIFREAAKSTIFMTPPTRGYRLMRDAALSLSLSERFPRPLINPRQSAPYDYVDGPLTTPDVDDFDGGPAPGAPFSNARLGTGYLLDRLGPGFTLVHVAGSGAPDADLMAALAVGAPPATLITLGGEGDIPDPDGRLARRLGAGPGALYLVRPDGHVAGRWRALDAAAVRAAFDRAMGRPA